MLLHVVCNNLRYWVYHLKNTDPYESPSRAEKAKKSCIAQRIIAAKAPANLPCKVSKDVNKLKPLMLIL